MFQIFDKRNLYFDLEDYESTYNHHYDKINNSSNELAKLDQGLTMADLPIDEQNKIFKHVKDNCLIAYYITPDNTNVQRVHLKVGFDSVLNKLYCDTPVFEKKYLIYQIPFMTLGTFTNFTFNEQMVIQMLYNGTPYRLDSTLYNNSYEKRRFYFEYCPVSNFDLELFKNYLYPPTPQ